MLGASCAEPSEARLRAADGSMIRLITSKAIEVREHAGDPQNASLLFKGGQAVFHFHSSCALPVLAITGFTNGLICMFESLLTDI